MYDLTSIVSDNELKTYFIETQPNIFTAYDAETDQPTGQFVEIDGVTFNCEDNFTFMQYKLWLTRPERCVGRPIALSEDGDTCCMDEVIDAYEEHLIGAYIMMAKKRNPKVKLSSLLASINSCLQWLRSTDFYQAPASTIYHENFVGGLLVHSVRVYNQALKLRQIDAFSSTSIADVTLAALVHDWCKINFYEQYEKNVKNEATGQWEKQTAFKRNPRGLTFGHGVTSMYLANRCFYLEPDVALAIRWHQGRWNCCEDEMNDLQRSNETYPIVHLIQFADQLAVTKYAK